MRLPHLNHYPATSMRRMPSSKETWARFLKHHHQSDYPHLLVNDKGPVAVFVPVALLGDLQELKRQIAGLKIWVYAHDQAEAFEFLAKPTPYYVSYVHNRLGAQLMGLVIPAEQANLFAL